MNSEFILPNSLEEFLQYALIHSSMPGSEKCEPLQLFLGDYHLFRICTSAPSKVLVIPLKNTDAWIGENLDWILNNSEFSSYSDANSPIYFKIANVAHYSIIPGESYYLKFHDKCNESLGVL